MGTYQGRHALIFAAAPETDYGYIRAFLREHPDALVACADGGLRHARALGLHPDFMISDRDSMTEVEGDDVILLEDLRRTTRTRRAVCGRCSAAAAARRRSCVRPAGASTICWQISRCLRKRKTLGGHLTILDPYNRVELHQGGRQEFIMPETFTYFSVVPMDAVLEGVTIENAKYELTNGTVTRVGMISTSNEAKPNSRFAVTIERGTALIIFSRDRVL